MARGVNKAILLGNLGSDPESRSLPNGNPVTNFTLATSKSWKDKDSRENRERTEWHRVVMFNRLAEIASQYLRKGAKVYIEGELRTRQWEKDGQKHYATEIVAREMQMLDSRRSDTNSGGYNDADSSHGTGDSHSTGGSHSTGSSHSSSVADGNANSGVDSPPAEDFDDDIPF